MVTKSELSAINRVDAINTLAITVVSYSFNIVDWKMEEIKKTMIEKQEITHLRKDAPPKGRRGESVPSQK